MTDDDQDPQMDYFDQDPSEVNAVPPLKVIDETKYLDDEIGRLLLEIYEQGRVTIQTLSETENDPTAKLKRQVGELRKQGYLGVDYVDGTKHYFVRSEWGTEEFPSGPIIPLVYQFNLLSDRQRMAALKEAIDETVEEGDVVADLGAGVGVLSHLAAERAERVYAVEMDREVFEKGREIMQKEGVENVEYIRGDAREVDLPQEVDVVLCELLDTALVAELQVPVMNYAVDNLLAADATVVPAEARTSMQLIYTDYDFYGTEFRLPHFEEYDSRESESRSEREVYHEISFAEHNSELVEERVTMEATEAGTVNGIQLNTDVRFAPDSEFVGASPWLDPPLNLPFEREQTVQAGDELTVAIGYELGGGLSNIAYEIVSE